MMIAFPAVDACASYPTDGVELQYRLSKKARQLGMSSIFSRLFRGKAWHTLGVYPSNKCAKDMRKKMCERAGGLWEYRIVKITDAEHCS